MKLLQHPVQYKQSEVYMRGSEVSRSVVKWREL
jgi:hypothetical protein